MLISQRGTDRNCLSLTYSPLPMSSSPLVGAAKFSTVYVHMRKSKTLCYVDILARHSRKLYKVVQLAPRLYCLPRAVCAHNAQVHDVMLCGYRSAADAETASQGSALFIYAQRRPVRSHEAKMCAQCRRAQTNSATTTTTTSTAYLSICDRTTRATDASTAICRINIRRLAPEGAGPETPPATPTSGGLADGGAERVGDGHSNGGRAARLSWRKRAML